MTKTIFEVLNTSDAMHRISDLIQAPKKTRRLERHKVANGRLFQLHATRGWKCIGRVLP